MTTIYPPFAFEYLDKSKMDSFDQLVQFHIDLLTPSISTYDYYNQDYFHILDNPPDYVTTTAALVDWLRTLPPPPMEPNLTDVNQQEEEEEEEDDYHDEFGIVDDSKLDPLLEKMFQDFVQKF